MTLVESVDDIAALAPSDPEMLSYLTQTTLSVDDTRDIIAALQHRFPAISGPRGEDICYATSNRQDAVKAIAGECDRMIVLGAPKLSTSLRLEIGQASLREDVCLYVSVSGLALSLKKTR